MPTLCRHFGTCGGCAFQDVPDKDYRARKRAIVVEALARAGVAADVVEDVAVVVPGTRRRAVFKAAKRAEAVLLGFHAARSHAIVDMRECLVLTKSLFGLTDGLRLLMGSVLREGESAEIHATEADNGFDLAIRWQRRREPGLVAEIARVAAKLGIIRVTAKGELLFELEPPTIAFDAILVRLPVGAFLQPTAAGERLLQARVSEALSGARQVADLFAGCGTFSLPLAKEARVHAVERDGAMVAALAEGARKTKGLKPVTTEKRDLERRPLVRSELAFDAVVLDPPRAGAAAQVGELAGSGIATIAYVSCDAQSFARDAATLVRGGYRLRSVLPVDQFLWSEHIELVGHFTRARR